MCFVRKFKFLPVFFLLLLPASLLAQGGYIRDVVLQRKTITNPGITYAQPVQGASVRVCVGAVSSNPCTPLASIYDDQLLTLVKSNPTSTDTNGNFGLWVASGVYTLGITVNGVTTNYTYTSVSPGSSPIATQGTIRLGNADTIQWRNAANSGNNLLRMLSNNNLNFLGSPTTAGIVGEFFGWSGTPIASKGVFRSLYAADTFCIRNATNTADLCFDAASGTAPNTFNFKTAVAVQAIKFVTTVATGTPPLTVTSTTPVANLAATPVTYNHSATQLTNAHVVVDSCTLGTDCAVTLTGAAVYTSSTSYTCVAQDQTAAAATKVVQASGSGFTITGTGTDAIRYKCEGN